MMRRKPSNTPSAAFGPCAWRHATFSGEFLVDLMLFSSGLYSFFVWDSLLFFPFRPTRCLRPPAAGRDSARVIENNEKQVQVG